MDRLNTTFLANELTYTKFQNIKFVESMIRSKDNKRKKIINKYIDIFNICMNNIKIAYNNNKEDLFFTIPMYINGMPEYNVIDCLNYIRKQLLELHMDVAVIYINNLFITWHYIEINRINQIT